jgi:hypothetical protein
MNSTTSWKCRSFAVTTMQLFAAAIAAIIISMGLRDRPNNLPSAMIRPHSIAERSSNARMRSRNSARGPSGPANHVSKSRRLRPSGNSRMPRQISAIVSVAINRSDPDRLSIQSATAGAGFGLRESLTMFVSRRYEVTAQHRGAKQPPVRDSSQLRPPAIGVTRPKSLSRLAAFRRPPWRHPPSIERPLCHFQLAAWRAYGQVPCLAPSHGPHIARAHVRRGGGDAP